MSDGESQGEGQMIKEIGIAMALKFQKIAAEILKCTRLSEQSRVQLTNITMFEYVTQFEDHVNAYFELNGEVVCTLHLQWDWEKRGMHHTIYTTSGELTPEGVKARVEMLNDVLALVERIESI